MHVWQKEKDSEQIISLQLMGVFEVFFEKNVEKNKPPIT